MEISGKRLLDNILKKLSLSEDINQPDWLINKTKEHQPDWKQNQYPDTSTVNQKVRDIVVSPSMGKSGFDLGGNRLGDIAANAIQNKLQPKPADLVYDLENDLQQQSENIVDILFSAIKTHKVYIPKFGQEIRDTSSGTVTTEQTTVGVYKWNPGVRTDNYLYLVEMDTTTPTDTIILVPAPERATDFFIDIKTSSVYTNYRLLPTKLYISIGQSTTYNSFIHSTRQRVISGSASEIGNQIVTFSRSHMTEVATAVSSEAKKLAPGYDQAIDSIYNVSNLSTIFQDAAMLGLIDSINIPLRLRGQQESDWPTSYVLSTTDFKDRVPFLKSDVPQPLPGPLNNALMTLLQGVRSLPTLSNSQTTLLENLRVAATMVKSSKLDTVYSKSHTLLSQILGSIIHQLSAATGSKELDFLSAITPWDTNKINKIYSLNAPSTVSANNKFPISILYITKDSDYGLKLHYSTYLKLSPRQQFDISLSSKYVEAGISNSFIHYMTAYAESTLPPENANQPITPEDFLEAVEKKTKEQSSWRSAEKGKLYEKLIHAFYYNGVMRISPNDSRTKLFINLPNFLKQDLPLLVTDKEWASPDVEASKVILGTKRTSVQVPDRTGKLHPQYKIELDQNIELQNNIIASCKPLKQFFTEYMEEIINTPTLYKDLEGSNGVIQDIGKRIGIIYNNIHNGFWTTPELKELGEIGLGDLYEESETSMHGSLSVNFAPDVINSIRLTAETNRLQELGLA